MIVEATNPKVMVIMEGSLGAETTKASSISGITHMVNDTRSRRTWVANQLVATIEHPTIGGQRGLLLGIDYLG